MATIDAATTVRVLVSAIPEDRLRSLFLELLLNGLADRPSKSMQNAGGKKASAERRRERARKWIAAKRQAAKAAADKPRRKRGRPKRAPDKPAGGNGAGEVTAEALWSHAVKLEPKAPWRAVARELGVVDGTAQAAHRNMALPPGLNADAVARFLTL
jgi:hypothetical protein